MIKLKEGMVVHCNTKEKATIFLKECEKQGITSCMKEPAKIMIDTWDELKEDTCYNITYEFARHLHIEFSSIYFYKGQGNKVLEFDDLFKEEKINEVIFNKPSFIHSDVEKVIRNGNTVICILDTGEKGIAKCCPGDKFDLKTGYEISYQRATIEKLKNEIKNEECILNIKSRKIIKTHDELLEQLVSNSMDALGNMKSRI